MEPFIQKVILFVHHLILKYFLQMAVILSKLVLYL